MTSEENNLREEKLPRELRKITAEWLTRTLATKYPGIEVKQLDKVEVINTHTTKVRVALSLNELGKHYGVPERLCLKSNWSGSSLSSGSGICELEARFYRYFRDDLMIPAPRCYFSDWDEDEFNQGLIVLEDLVDSGAVFCSASEAITAEQARVSLDGLVKMHAGCWANPLLEKHSWLKVSMSSDTSDPKLYRSLEPHMLDNIEQEDRRAVLPQWFLEKPKRLSDAYDKLVAYEVSQAGPRTLIHGDAHLGNSYVMPSGERRWLDWQIVRKGTPWRDLNYFLTSSLEVDERRQHERALFEYYLDRMIESGCDMPTVDDAWAQYQLWPIHGLASFNGSRDEWQVGDSILAGVKRFSAAIEDHDSVVRINRLVA